MSIPVIFLSDPVLGFIYIALAHLLDVVVRQSASIFQLLAREDQSLLVGWDALFVLDLALDVVDGIGGLHLEGDGLARQGLHEAEINVSRCCESGVVGLRFRSLTSALREEVRVGNSITGVLKSSLTVGSPSRYVVRRVGGGCGIEVDEQSDDECEIQAKTVPECGFSDWSRLKSGSLFFLASTTTKMDSALSSNKVHMSVYGESA